DDAAVEGVDGAGVDGAVPLEAAEEEHRRGELGDDGAARVDGGVVAEGGAEEEGGRAAVDEEGGGLLGRVVLEEAVLEEGGGEVGDVGGAGGEAAGVVVADDGADEPGAALVDVERARAGGLLQHGVLDEPHAPLVEGEGVDVPAERHAAEDGGGALE